MRSSRIILVTLLVLLTASLVCAANPWYHIGAAKKLADGSPVSLTNLVATCGSTDSPSRVYVQEAGTDCGIWVQTPQQVDRGVSCSASGTVRTDTATGERYILGTLASAPDEDQPSPMGMVLRSLGGGNLGALPAGQQGISGASGLNNIGLLVRVWGKVTQIGADYLYIDDGSGLKDGTVTGSDENIGVRIVCNPTGYSAGDKIEVTGISSCFKVTSQIMPRILTRDSDDVRKILPPTDQLFTPNYVADLDGNLLHWDHLPITVSFNLPANWATIYGSQSNLYIQAANEWTAGQSAMIQVVQWGSTSDVTVEFVNQSVFGGSVWGRCSYSYYPSLMQMATATVQVALYDTQNNTTSAVDMKSVIAHELGHALGIGGHSANSTDLMYPTITFGVPKLATVRDLNTAKCAYPSYFGVSSMLRQATSSLGKPAKAVIE